MYSRTSSIALKDSKESADLKVAGWAENVATIVEVGGGPKRVPFGRPKGSRKRAPSCTVR